MQAAALTAATCGRKQQTVSERGSLTICGNDEVAMSGRAYQLLTALVVIILLTGCSREAGVPRNSLATAEETVRAYCDLDARGARLTSTTWSKVLPYISWTEEAGFDRAVVISGYSIGKVTKKDQETTVVVEYRVLGVVTSSYEESERTETVRFKVSLTDRGWKITEPDFMPPHVLASVMAEHLEGTKRRELENKGRERKP